MNIDTILVTTRLFYSIQVQPENLIEIDSNKLIHFAELVRTSQQKSDLNPMENVDYFDPYADEDDEDPIAEEGDSTSIAFDYTAIIKQLFKDGGSAEDIRSYNYYWEDSNSKLCLKKIFLKEGNHSFNIYVAPCFPTNYKKNNIKIRHIYLKTIFGNLLSSHSLLLAHDKDLYQENDERCLSVEDCISGSSELSEKIIPFNQVFGFQHVFEPNRIFTIFIKKLGTLSFEDCLHAINNIQQNISNRKIFEQIDSYPFDKDGELKLNTDENGELNTDENLKSLTKLINSIV